MKFKPPGKKAVFLVATLAAAGGGGFAAVKYLGVDRQQLLAWLPLETAKQYMGMLGLMEKADDGLRPSDVEGEKLTTTSRAAEAAPSHDTSQDDEKPPEPNHSADTAKADDHAQTPDQTEGDAHSETAEPDIPYVAPESLQSPLVRQVRLLQSVQERLARGDKEAVKEQRELLIQLGENASKLQVEQASVEEIYASVTYLLSGGRPDIVARFLQRKELPHATHKLLAGAIAYVRGESASASDQLRGLDPLQFGPSIAGHLAMVQASAVEDLTPSRRRELLELTTNTMLGTLLEEAALRRLMELAADNKDINTFLRSASRYSRRFSNSLYNAEYRNALLQGIIKLEAAKRGLSPAQLDLLIFEKSAERRNDILGSLAEASLRAGLSSLCRYAAGRGRRLSHEGSVPWTRASLYHASCSVTEGGASAVASLKSLNAELLDHEDKELLRSALLLAEHAALAGKPTAVTTSQLSAKEALTEDQAAFRDKLRDDLASVSQVMEGSKE